MSFGPPDLLAPLTSLFGIRPGMNVTVKNPPKGFLEALVPLPEGAALVETSKTGIDLTVLFAHQKLALVDALTRAVQQMNLTGSIWVVIPTTETLYSPSEDFVRMAGFELGLEENRRVLLGQEWVALRFQRRKSGTRLEKPQAEA